MPKYLVHGSYTVVGGKGLLKDGGSKRRAATAAMVASVGGTLETYYFAFGESDFYGVADLPDNQAAVALSLSANLSGAVAVTTVPLLTPEEVDDAVKRSVKYSPPGT